MQQTETYKLNKPETTDVFTPAPLNENADKIDATLADVSQRVIKLEGCRIVVGTYQNYTSREGQLINLGARPVAVLAAGHSVDGPHMGFVVGEEKGYANGQLNLAIVDNGFMVYDLLTNNELTFSFMAFMGDWVPMNVPKYQKP